ncbi:MAG: SAM-dependent methyltransferase [Ignavibacteria bacterium]|nr:SAM-dependent methyltransferase [Ignavibacteria bacterium]
MDILIKPIAYVSNQIKKRKDDNWKNVVSIIKLNKDIPTSSISGLEKFSHLEVVFYFNKVRNSDINFGLRHPRNNTNYPKTGIFSQRASKRPNLIGVTIVKLLDIGNRNITVKGLDAIDGTPVIDLKPVMKEFLPLRKEIRQPLWAKELMKQYW